MRSPVGAGRVWGPVAAGWGCGWGSDPSDFGMTSPVISPTGRGPTVFPNELRQLPWKLLMTRGPSPASSLEQGFVGPVSRPGPGLHTQTCPPGMELARGASGQHGRTEGCPAPAGCLLVGLGAHCLGPGGMGPPTPGQLGSRSPSGLLSPWPPGQPQAGPFPGQAEPGGGGPLSQAGSSPTPNRGQQRGV